MLDAETLNTADLEGLSKRAALELVTRMWAQLEAKDAQLEARDEQIARCDREIKFKDAKLERITFELARLKAWKFGAKTEAMNAEQRRLFEETLAEDEASLEEQLRALQRAA